MDLLRRIARYLKNAALHWLKKIGILLAVVLTVIAIWAGIGLIDMWWDRRDAAPYRGAELVAGDPFDAPVERIVYLDQGWSEADSLWFYKATQGSNLLPYDFFLALEQPGSDAPFRENGYLNAYRYLARHKTLSNPDALPVGFALDAYQGREYLGFTCAACHTSQVNHKGVGIRIDGGPAAADMENFLHALGDALSETLADASRNERFVAQVLSAGSYDSRAAVESDLVRYSRQIQTYTQVNAPIDGSGTRTHYGFARLDAFGRIYNRVLQHILNAGELRRILRENLPDDIYQRASADLESILSDEDQTRLFARALAALEPHLPDGGQQVLDRLRLDIFNPANAPVSYPYLWDIPQHDYVQWTGLVSNGGIGPLGRNVGQVIGVFGSLDWQRVRGWSLQAVLGGQGLGSSYVDFKSSIDKRNLRRVEKLLRSLISPRWPEQYLGEINRPLAARGERLFDRYCAGCHSNIDRADPERRVIAHLGHVDSVGTDPQTALNALRHSGYTGVLKSMYVDAGVGKLVLENRSPVAPLVKMSTRNVVTSWDPDRAAIQRSAEWLFDTLFTLFDNNVKTSLKRGDYDPATTRDPFASLYAYKARSLNGIWATAPYLHNGSVPSLYDLFLPAMRVGDAQLDSSGELIEYRPDSFLVGSRELDTVKVGFRYEGYGGFVFDTDIPGNANTGHEYAAGRTPLADGRLASPLNREQRFALLEYLKTL